MKIPKGEPLHKNLSSSFTNLRKLVEELKKNSFSGIVETIGVNADGLILIDSGNVVGVRLKRGEDNVEYGKEFLNSLYELAESEELMISTFKLPPESIIYLALFIKSKIVESGIKTEKIPLDTILEKYKNGSGDFFIEVQFNKNLGVGLIFIQEGIVMDGLLSLLGKELSISETAIKGIMEGAGELGAVVNVYKTEFDPEVTGMMTLNFSDEEKTDFFNELFSLLYSSFKNKLNHEDFEVVVRETCLELADKFPVLDPFLGEFLYKNGKVTIKTMEEDENLVESIFSLLKSFKEKSKTKGWNFDVEHFKSAAKDKLSEKNPVFYEKYDIEDRLNEI